MRDVAGLIQRARLQPARALVVAGLTVMMTSASAAARQASPTPGPAASPARLAHAAFFEGCWRLTAGERVVEEQWMTARGGTMLGVSRTVRGEKTLNYEFVVLREAEGRLQYEAHPSGQAPGTFLSVTSEPARIVFENTAHDFPQRIGYEKRGDGLFAWIEGSMNGQNRRIEYPYARAACPAS